MYEVETKPDNIYKFCLTPKNNISLPKWYTKIGRMNRTECINEHFSYSYYNKCIILAIYVTHVIDSISNSNNKKKQTIIKQKIIIIIIRKHPPSSSYQNKIRYQCGLHIKRISSLKFKFLFFY